jgi:hypothetical protein
MLWLMLLLGAYHGINPRYRLALRGGARDAGAKGKAVARALVPIAVGHAVAIGVAVSAVALLGFALPLAVVRYSIAGLLVGLGL